MSQRYIDGPFCRRGSIGASPENCERCRDQGIRGETFRTSLARTSLVLPVVADGEPPDRFPCPSERGSRPWGWRAPYQIPADFSPAVEVRRLKSGGCCGKPSSDSQ